MTTITATVILPSYKPTNEYLSNHLKNNQQPRPHYSPSSSSHTPWPWLEPKPKPIFFESDQPFQNFHIPISQQLSPQVANVFGINLLPILILAPYLCNPCCVRSNCVDNVVSGLGSCCSTLGTVVLGIIRSLGCSWVYVGEILRLRSMVYRLPRGCLSFRSHLALSVGSYSSNPITRSGVPRT